MTKQVNEQLTILRKLGIENPSEEDIPLIPYLVQGWGYDKAKKLYDMAIEAELSGIAMGLNHVNQLKNMFKRSI